MPFASRKQQRAAFAGKIPGISKDDAKEWAAATDFKDLPERSASQKGKPTLRSKAGKKKLAAVVGALEDSLIAVLKQASLGAVNALSKNVGRFSGMQTEHALKSPGVAASTQAVNPRRSIKNAINAGKA